MLLYVNSSQASENSTQLYGQSRNDAFSATRFKEVLAKVYLHLSLRVRSYHRSHLEVDHISFREVTIINPLEVSKQIEKAKALPREDLLAENRRNRLSSCGRL